mgnify:CR=1 FL=1|jgi:hypothetical protein
MGYGVTFNNKHSFKSFGLIMQKVAIGMPRVKTEIIDIPGADGSKDLSETLASRPLYGNREISITLAVPHECHDWLPLISRVSNFIHGQSMKIVFDSDPQYFYKGRCSVETVNTWEALPEIAIKITADPFKISEKSKEVSISGTTTIEFDETKRIVITELQTASSGMSYTVRGKQIQVNSGNNKANIDLFGHGQIIISGYGKIKIKYETREI